MKRLSLQAGIVVVTMCLPSLANAYCPKDSSTLYRGFEDQVSGYIDYLLCLHNEQVTSLNEHARLINQLGDDVDGIRRASTKGRDAAAVSVMREVVVKYTAVEQENERLRRRIEELEVRLERVERQTDAK